MSIKYYLLLALLIVTHTAHAIKPVTVVINPAGSLHNPGRTIGTHFERTIALDVALALQKKLEVEHANINVVLTRQAGTSNTTPFYEAQLSNRLEAVCFISLNFFYDDAIRPSVYLYQFSYGEDFVTTTPILRWQSYDKAYLINKSNTQQWATATRTILQQDMYASYFVTQGPYHMPFKPLIGVIAPALGFDIGLKKASDATRYVEPLAECIRWIINQLY